MKAENYWKEYQFYTGNSMEDIEVKRDVLSIVQSAKYVISFCEIQQAGAMIVVLFFSKVLSKLI